MIEAAPLTSVDELVRATGYGIVQQAADKPVDYPMALQAVRSVPTHAPNYTALCVMLAAAALADPATNVNQIRGDAPGALNRAKRYLDSGCGAHAAKVRRLHDQLKNTTG